MQNNWLHKILNYKATPPDGAWKDIANKLDSEEGENDISDFASKMNAYEETPPASAFSNIFNALDDKDNHQETKNSTEKIYNYSETPPAGTWQNITAELDKNEAAIISIDSKKNNLKLIYRIAAAASVVTLILVTAFLFTKKNTAETSDVVNATPKNNEINSTIQKTNNSTANLPTAIAPDRKSNDVAVLPQKTKKIINKSINDGYNSDYVKNTEVAELATKPDATDKEKLKNSSGKTPMDIGLMGTPNTYISITGPDGQSVKVSSKFSNLIEYFKGKNPDTVENLEVIISESAKWRNTFATWRDKMTNNAIAPSIGNFMDLIELSKVLEDKK